ncbi:MAG: adenylate/guanylate cyclase domain-containing protein, partial [Treponema sp.]|nr:adenylate/guanylate cyclase domain-containing protein [Treponema sp.]
RGEIKPGGQPKLATIFFSDMRGFTEKSTHFTEKFGDEASSRIVLWLNDYFTRMVDCILKTGGVVDKFDGDALMAHWGTIYTSGSPERDAFNCIFSALMMRKSLYELNKTRSPEDWSNPPIQIGCGISTGIVTAGQIGSEVRMDYTVIGDPVNLASRAEELNKSLATDILITEDTWNLVKDQFITEEMPTVKLKGKDTLTRIFAVINFSKIDKWPYTLSDVRRLLGISSISYKRRLSDISVGGNSGGLTERRRKTDK